jgi:predicted transcriptional regulator
MTPKLPRREREVYEILCAAAPITAAAVRERMADAPGSSAVRTLLSRLEGRGLVAHVETGRHLSLQPHPGGGAGARIGAQPVRQNLFEGSAISAATALLGMSREADPQELAALEEALAQARARAAGRTAVSAVLLGGLAAQSTLAALAARSSLAAVLGLGGLWLLRRRSPLDRAVWLKLALGLLLAMPLLPRVHIPMPAAVTAMTAPAPVQVAVSAMPADKPAPQAIVARAALGRACPMRCWRWLSMGSGWPRCWGICCSGWPCCADGRAWHGPRRSGVA